MVDGGWGGGIVPEKNTTAGKIAVTKDLWENRV